MARSPLAGVAASSSPATTLAAGSCALSLSWLGVLIALRVSRPPAPGGFPAVPIPGTRARAGSSPLGAVEINSGKGACSARRAPQRRAAGVAAARASAAHGARCRQGRAVRGVAQERLAAPLAQDPRLPSRCPQDRPAALAPL